MSHRSIGQERFGFGRTRYSGSSLDELVGLIEWAPVAVLLDPLYSAAKGEPAWPPLAMFKALLLSIWYDLSDVKLAEALDDRASFRRICGFSSTEATPERTAFVRVRKLLVAHGLDARLFEAVTTQLKAKAVKVNSGTLVDATIMTSTSKEDGDSRWVKQGQEGGSRLQGPCWRGCGHIAGREDLGHSANMNDGRAGPEAGGECAAAIYSVIDTAEMNGLEAQA